MTTFLILTALFALLAAGVPVAFALGGLGVILLLIGDFSPLMVPQAFLSTIDNFVLLDHAGNAHELYYQRDAKAVVLIGEMRGRAFMDYASYLSDMSMDGWGVIGHAAVSLAAETRDLGPEDAGLVLTQTPYATRTIETARLVASTGTPLIAITDRRYRSKVRKTVAVDAAAAEATA